MDAHRKRHLNQDYLTPGNKREGAYGCCLDLIASQNTSEIEKFGGVDTRRERHLEEDYLTPSNKGEGAYGCCLDLMTCCAKN